jgi:hypothetical protein
MRSALSIRVVLPPDALAGLQLPVRGRGGFQSLLRALQRHIENGNELVLTPQHAARIAMYVRQYGGGGFQGRLDLVLKELADLARALRPIAA